MVRRLILSLSERESLLALPDDELTLTSTVRLWRSFCGSLWPGTPPVHDRESVDNVMLLTDSTYRT